MRTDAWVNPANDVVRVFREILTEAFARGSPDYPHRPSWVAPFLLEAQVTEHEWQEAGIRFNALLAGAHADRGMPLDLADRLSSTIGPLPLAARNAFWAIFGQVALYTAADAARPAPALEIRGRGEFLDAARPSNDIVVVMRLLCQQAQDVIGYRAPPWLMLSAARYNLDPVAIQAAATMTGAFYTRRCRGDDLETILQITVDRIDPRALALVWSYLGRAFFATFVEASDPFPERNGVFAPRARVSPAALVDIAIEHHGSPLGLRVTQLENGEFFG